MLQYYRSTITSNNTNWKQYNMITDNTEMGIWQTKGECHLLQKTWLWTRWSSVADSPTESRPISVSTSDRDSPKCLLLASIVSLHLVDWYAVENTGSAAVCVKCARPLSLLVWLLHVFTGPWTGELVPRLLGTLWLTDTFLNSFSPQFSLSAATAAPFGIVWFTAASSKVFSGLWFSVWTPKLPLFLQPPPNFSQ